MRFTALWLSGIIVVVYALQQLFSTEPFLLISSLKFAEPWRLLTSVFSHGSPAHLLNNLFALVLFGLILEGRIGPKRLLWLFLATGIIVNIFSPYPRSLGASGAIYGILGALVALRPMMVIWLQWMPMPMVVAGAVWLLQDVFGVFYPSGVANLAHISGLFIGVAAGLYWRKRGYGDKIDASAKIGKDTELERRLDDWEREHMLRK
ncbi:rhomboid family intramembrane serine protease [Candidatus Woesearchaeota archaeon]|nr:rhomboid family intramembrane serine protease [Candidatus Woesearchaeota archaeon]